MLTIFINRDLHGGFPISAVETLASMLLDTGPYSAEQCMVTLEHKVINIDIGILVEGARPLSHFLMQFYWLMCANIYFVILTYFT